MKDFEKIAVLKEEELLEEKSMEIFGQRFETLCGSEQEIVLEELF